MLILTKVSFPVSLLPFQQQPGNSCLTSQGMARRGAEIQHVGSQNRLLKLCGREKLLRKTSGKHMMRIIPLPHSHQLDNDAGVRCERKRRTHWHRGREDPLQPFCHCILPTMDFFFFYPVFRHIYVCSAIFGSIYYAARSLLLFFSNSCIIIVIIIIIRY